LGELGAREAVPYIIKLLKDEDELVRWASAMTIIKMRGKNNITQSMLHRIKGIVKNTPEDPLLYSITGRWENLEKDIQMVLKELKIEKSG